MAQFQRNHPLEEARQLRNTEDLLRRRLRAWPLSPVNQADRQLGTNDVSGFRDGDGVYQEFFKAGDIVGVNPVKP